MIFTHNRMLELWKQTLGLDLASQSCVVERVDGIDIDSRLSTLMRQWYLSLLDSAPLCHLIPSDLASDPAVSIAKVRHLEGVAVAEIHLPEKVRRVLSVELTSWEVPATPVLAPTDEPSKERQRILNTLRNPFTLPSAQAPAAWLLTDGATLLVAPAAAADSIKQLIAVADTGPDTYSLKESAISLIPKEIHDAL